MPVVKTQVNIRLTSDVNTSFSLESIIDDEEEAIELGKQLYRLQRRIMDGFGEAAKDDEIE